MIDQDCIRMLVSASLFWREIGHFSGILNLAHDIHLIHDIHLMHDTHLMHDATLFSSSAAGRARIYMVYLGLLLGPFWHFCDSSMGLFWQFQGSFIRLFWQFQLYLTVSGLFRQFQRSFMRLF